MSSANESEIMHAPRHLEILLELPLGWSSHQAEMLAERLLAETPSAVGVSVWQDDHIFAELRAVADRGES